MLLRHLNVTDWQNLFEDGNIKWAEKGAGLMGDGEDGEGDGGKTTTTSSLCFTRQIFNTYSFPADAQLATGNILQRDAAQVHSARDNV